MKPSYIVTDLHGSLAASNPLTTALIHQVVETERERGHQIIWTFMKWMPVCAPFLACDLALTKEFNLFSPNPPPHKERPALTPAPQDIIIPKWDEDLMLQPHAEQFLRDRGSAYRMIGNMAQVCILKSCISMLAKGFNVEVADRLTVDTHDRLLRHTDQMYKEANIERVDPAKWGLTLAPIAK